ncbi:hypothetical protein B0H13DRAFT_2311259 [Mycena leptocephala]|nr:hypothetical protein B0H13DRAFT_2311259 [Mycena leptocephala]
MGHPTQGLLGRTRWLHVLFLLPNQLKRTNQLFESAHQLKTTLLYSPCQCQKDLIDDFSARLNYFIDAQAYHTRIGFPPFPVIFDFSGEYSIVAADYDIAGRKFAVDFRVDSIEDSVGSVTRLTFGPRTFYIRRYGVITRLCCFKTLHPLPAIYAPTLAPRNMLGELEIFVLPNVSHRYFPGEKTIVRFRFFG